MLQGDLALEHRAIIAGLQGPKAHDASRTAKRTADHDATFDDHAWREELSVRPILPSTMKDTTSWISAVMLTTSANTLNGECDEAPASEHVGTDVVPNPCSIIQKYRSALSCLGESVAERTPDLERKPRKCRGFLFIWQRCWKTAAPAS